MRHRVRLCLVGSALIAILSDCGGDALPMRCSLTSVSLEGNALTLLADARLDRVGDGFVLLGADKDNVRWATLSPAGVLGTPGMVAVPSHTDGPWFGVAGLPASPGSVLVVAYAANPAGGTADLMTFTVDVAGGAASPPVAIGKIPDRATTPVVVTAGTGRKGEHVGISWSRVGTSQVSAFVLGPDGRPLASTPLTVGMVDDLDCLRFVPGKEDLTLSYVRADIAASTYTLLFQEIKADGTQGISRTLSLGSSRAGCAAMVPTDTGYGIAWKEIGDPPAKPGRGDIFAAVPDTGTYFPSLVLSNERVSGGDAPPIVGVGASTSTKFTLLFAHRSGGEAWQVDYKGNRTSQSVVLPSSHGNSGAVSSSPVGPSLFATYADYASADPANQAAGRRLFLELTCK